MEKLVFNIGDAMQAPFREVTDVGEMASVFLSNAIIIAGVILIFSIVIAGIIMITGAGNPQQMERGRQIITTSVIGFILVTAAYLIVRLIESSTGVDILG